MLFPPHPINEVGDQWKGEMESLTRQFESKLKSLGAENRRLRTELASATEELKTKETELREAEEMNGIYSGKLTKLERKFKKLRDEDEESYMEMII